MQHTNISFFQRIKDREINGSKLTNTRVAYSSQNEMKAKKLIVKIENEYDLNKYLAYLDKLKNLALLKVKPAIEFYQGLIKFNVENNSLEINNAIDFAVREIGYYTETPKFLCETFYVSTGLYGYNPALRVPRIQDAFNCLLAAANMHGKDATAASYILAYLYSSQLGFHFQDRRPIHLGSLNYFYHTFVAPLNKLSDIEIRELIQVKNINYYQIRLEGEIAFANLGCDIAINNLIDWYSDGNISLQINIDTVKAQAWQQRLRELPVFLKNKYNEYYALAIKNTKHFGCCTVGTPAVGINYFVEVWCKIEFGENYQKDVVLNAIKKEFIEEANSGNMATCLDLGNLGLLNEKFADAKMWFNKILEIYNKSSMVNSSEAALAARKCYEISIIENASPEVQYQLVLQAANLGCMESIIELGEIKLKQNELDDAKKWFNIAITHSSSTDTAYTICKKLFEALPDYTLELLEPYYLWVKGEEIKKGSISGILDMQQTAQLNGDGELAASWMGIQQLRDQKVEIDVGEIDKLVAKTIESCAFSNGYGLEQQMARLTL